MDLSPGVNPLDGTNYLDTVSAFIEGFLHLLAGEGAWGRGRNLSPFPQKSFRNLPAVLFALKKHHRCASRFGCTSRLDLLLDLFGRTIPQRRVQAQPIRRLIDEPYDICSQMYHDAD